MRRSVNTAIGVGLIAVLTVGALATANNPKHQFFKDQTRERLSTLEATVGEQAAEIAGLRADIAAIAADIDVLSGNDAVLDEGLMTLRDLQMTLDQNLAATQDIVFEAHPAIELTDITADVVCDGTECEVRVEWFSDPPATGQVEWGETEAYGNLTAEETAYLDFHSQPIGTFPEDGATYHFRVLAETPDLVATGASTFVATSATA